nr:MAG TPA: hypothetical protein [Caudoviricetes sp.]
MHLEWTPSGRPSGSRAQTKLSLFTAHASRGF